ncbi:hypothetical protein PSTG_03623 [Puccinia striiformis f. sp. tritici PST-78]|uniref:4a-hydroxytetrahydrobiopterin dehydratase n=1 Tax=Puccinia striiformis f. sp. tritici PST-78 TaxID=1165861 RepID=A0A0L0VUT2_9BASI|nr:hypothetical protein PSTG_03623 [Puccinia striiformis f. sp. tritici PST-78]
MLAITHLIGCLRTRLGRTGTVRIARLTGVDLTMKRPTIQSTTTERSHSSSDNAYADLSRRKPESKDSRADDRPTTIKLPRTYTTRESVEEALRSDRYNSLAGSGWRIDDILLPDQSAVVVLRKDFPANQPFRSWHEILDWVQNDLRPIADELDHHPDISITQFNHLRLTLFTHSLKAITPRDFRLAVQIQESIPQKRRVF